MAFLTHSAARHAPVRSAAGWWGLPVTGQYADSSEPAYLTERVGTAELSGRGIGYSELDVFALREAVIDVRERSSRGQHRGGIRASRLGKYP